MKHLNDNLLLRYASRSASEQDCLRVEEHVADCPQCLGRLRGLNYLRDDFVSVWASWTAAEHARLCRQWKVAVALNRIVESVPALAEKARHWLENIGLYSIRALNLLVDKAQGIAGIGSGVLPGGYAFRLEPAIVGVGAPDTEADSYIRKGAELLSRGEGEAAARELAEARRIDARLPQAARSQVSRDGCRQAQIVVDGRRGRAAVRYWPREGETVPDLVLLLPEGQAEEALAAELQAVEGEDYLLAEFSGVPEGQLELYW